MNFAPPVIAAFTALSVVGLARAQAPSSLSGFTLHESYNLGPAAMYEDTETAAIDLLPDGSYVTHFLTFTQTLATPNVSYVSPVGGTYTYSVTSTNQATLTLTGGLAGGSLTFSSASGGALNSGISENEGSFSMSPTGGNPSTRALVNISTLVFVGQATPATVGFVLGGSQSRELLIRAVGPTLSQFGIANFAPNPGYFLSPNTESTADYPGELTISPHDPHQAAGWSATAASAATLSAEAARVGAFPLLQGSNDKADIFLLEPGAYSITVAPSGSTAAGMVLIEVYEVE